MPQRYTLIIYTSLLILATMSTKFLSFGENFSISILNNATFQWYHPSEDTTTNTLEISAVANTKRNELYIGIDNPISIASPNVSWEYLKVTTTGNCRIYNAKGRGKYSVFPSREGETTITVTDVRTGEQQSFPFIIKRVPDPTIKLGGLYTHGLLSAAEFKAHKGLVAVLEGTDIDLSSKIRSFTLYRVTQRGEITEVTYRGDNGVFRDDVREVIDLATSGDTYTFVDIRASNPTNSCSMKINTLSFQIK